MNHIERFAPVVGRLFLSLIFITSGFGKITGFAGTVAYMETYGMPMANLLLMFGILFELGGGLMLLLGFQARIAATMLIIFTVVATIIFHNFWALEGAERAMQMTNFLKNLSMIGGLLLVLGFGAGPYNLEPDGKTQ